LKLDWKAGLGLAVSALLLWWVFRGEDLGQIARGLASADLVMLIASGAIVTAGGLIRAFRWTLLLEPLGAATSLGARWAALNIGFMVTNVLGGRFGEVARPFALSRMAPVTMSGALGTVVLERVLDAVALLVLLLVTLLSPAFPRDATVMGRPLGYAVSGAIAVAALALALVSMMLVWPALVLRVVRALARVLPDHMAERVVAAVEAFLPGLDLARRPAALLKALLWSLLLWAWMAAAFWTAFRAFGLDLGVTAALFAQCSVSIFVALPAGPGFLGTMQAGVGVAVHEVFGVAMGPTLALSIGYQLAGFIPVTLLGLYYAYGLGIRLGSLEEEAETALGKRG
jgi:hypothetical protein